MDALADCPYCRGDQIKDDGLGGFLHSPFLPLPVITRTNAEREGATALIVILLLLSGLMCVFPFGASLETCKGRRAQQ